MRTAAEHYWGSEHHFTGAGMIDYVWAERLSQLDKWGTQRHPDGTGKAAGGRTSLEASTARELADAFRSLCQNAAKNGTLTWRHILLEEVFEAIAEDDPAKLRTELVQSAAVIAAWVEDIDSREPADG